MSPLGIASTALKLVSFLSDAVSNSSASSASSNSSAMASTSGVAGRNGDFASSLALRLAEARAGSSNAADVLGNLSASRSGSGSFLDFLSAGGVSDPISLINLNGKRAALSASGRNLSLFDPESAFRMMTEINRRDVNYKAQFAELSEMGGDLAEMKQAGEQLATSSTGGSDAQITAALQSFAAKYNEWVDRYDDSVASGGVLAGTQAAEVALYELRESINNGFNGAMNGVHGLRDLGFSIDPVSGRASLDVEKLGAMLGHNRVGVQAAIGEFSQNFAKSAELLVSANNFVPNRLANLDRVIDYINDNKTSLQAEFGLGDAARPSGAVAQALAAYEAMRRA